MASVEGPSPVVERESSMSAGEFVLKKLFAEFVALSERKLQSISTQPFVSTTYLDPKYVTKFTTGYYICRILMETYVLDSNAHELLDV